MPVLDASALVAYLGGGPHANAVEHVVLDAAGSLYAPHLIDAEVGHVLRRATLRGNLDAETAAAALEDLADLPLVRVPHTSLLLAAWAMRSNLSFYDALYVALAARLDEPLLTLDARLAAAPRMAATVIVLG